MPPNAKINLMSCVIVAVHVVVKLSRPDSQPAPHGPGNQRHNVPPGPPQGNRLSTRRQLAALHRVAEQVVNPGERLIGHAQ